MLRGSVKILIFMGVNTALNPPILSSHVGPVPPGLYAIKYSVRPSLHERGKTTAVSPLATVTMLGINTIVKLETKEFTNITKPLHGFIAVQDNVVFVAHSIMDTLHVLFCRNDNASTTYHRFKLDHCNSIRSLVQNLLFKHVESHLSLLFFGCASQIQKSGFGLKAFMKQGTWSPLYQQQKSSVAYWELVVAPL